jgi:hypothetical protein
MDTSNYYPFRDGELQGLMGKTESEYISETLSRPVIKVFNNILEYTLKHNGKASGEEGRIAISVAGDNEQHKKVAAELVDQTGFDTVDWWKSCPILETGTRYPTYCTDLNAAELKQALADAEKGKAPGLRDLAITKFMKHTTPLSHKDMVKINRSLFAANSKKT